VWPAGGTRRSACGPARSGLGRDILERARRAIEGPAEHVGKVVSGQPAAGGGQGGENDSGVAVAAVVGSASVAVVLEQWVERGDEVSGVQVEVTGEFDEHPDGLIDQAAGALPEHGTQRMHRRVPWLYLELSRGSATLYMRSMAP